MCKYKLRAGRSGDRIPVGGELFRTRPDRHWGPPCFLYNGYRFPFQGIKRPGREADNPPRLKKKYSYTSTQFWTLVSCSRVNFTSKKYSYTSTQFWTLVSCSRVNFTSKKDFGVLKILGGTSCRHVTLCSLWKPLIRSKQPTASISRTKYFHHTTPTRQHSSID
jgi:hypothetical protein